MFREAQLKKKIKTKHLWFFLIFGFDIFKTVCKGFINFPAIGKNTESYSKSKSNDEMHKLRKETVDLS